MLRDQIRFRLYVLQTPRGGTPAIGNGAGQVEFDRLYSAVVEMIQKEGPLVVSSPLPSLRPDLRGEHRLERNVGFWGRISHGWNVYWCGLGSGNPKTVFEFRKRGPHQYVFHPRDIAAQTPA